MAIWKNHERRVRVAGNPEPSSLVDDGRVGVALQVVKQVFRRDCVGSLHALVSWLTA